MNLRAGLFRLWLVLSLIWFCVHLWRNDAVGCLLSSGSGRPWCAYRDTHYYATLFGEASLPFLVGIGVLLAIWVIAGFQPKNPN